MFKYIKRTLLGILLTVYIAVALVNYSVVQQIAGSVASTYFSKEWNTKVRVQSLSFNILDHITLRGIELYTPEGDTVYVGEKISVRFDELPISSKGLKLERVYMKNAYYCLEKYPGDNGINLNFIINHYKKEKDDDDTTHNRFVISVNQLTLRNIEYMMYLPGYQDFEYEHGVNVKAMNFKNINARMKNIRVDASYISTRIESFSAEEVSGFNLHNLKGNAYVSPNAITLTDMEVETDFSKLNGSASLLYNGWEEMSDYLNKVHMVAEFNPGSYGGLKDAAYWAPMLWGFDAKVNVQGKFYGTVADMHTDYAKLQIEDHTTLIMNGYITGLPNMKETIIKGDIERLTTTVDLFSKVGLPYSWPKFKMPAILKPLNEITLSGTFIGTIYEFFATANINTSIGRLTAYTDFYQSDVVNGYAYNASISSPKINVARLLPNDWLTSTGLNINLEGEGFDLSTMRLDITDALFSNAKIRNNYIDAINISASLNEMIADLKLNVADTNLDIDLYANANMQDSVNKYIGSISINNINLSDFELWKTEKDTSITLATIINANMEGNSVDQLCGHIFLENTELNINPNNKIFFQNISIGAKELNNYRNVTLNISDFARLETKGYFKYSDFGTITQKFFNSFVPKNYNVFLNEKSADAGGVTDAEFDFSFVLTDTNNLIAKIVPGLYIAPKTSVEGSYNYTQSLKLDVVSKLVAYNSMALDKLNISAKERSGIYTLNMKSPKLYTESSSILENINITLNSTPMLLQLQLLWNANDNTAKNMGNINIDVTNNLVSNMINIYNSHFVINGERWNITNNGNIILFDTNTLQIHNLQFGSNKQSLTINSDIVKGTKDSLDLIFDNFSLEQFNALLANTDLTLNGIIKGNLNIKDLYTSPYFDAELAIHDWKINNQDIGNANITSNWDVENKALNINLQSNLERNDKVMSPLTASGYFYPTREDDNIDFEVNFDGFSLKSIEPFLKSFSSRFEGNLHGAFDIKGNIKDPKISGSTMVENGVIKIDYTNTSYFFSDSIIIDNQNIVLKDFEIKDEKDNAAYIKGDITHSGFKNFNFDIDLTTNNFLVVNTTQVNELPFYGTIYATADVKVSGTDKNINILVESKTNRNSVLSIPLNDKRILKEQNFIQFVQREKVVDESYFSNKSKPADKSLPKINYKVSLNIEATPDIKVNLPMDFSSIKAVVSATGSGDLRLNINSDDPFSMMGDYNINSGTFKVDFMNLLSRELKIENGSSLNWTGDPANAAINIDGIYERRVSLSSLTGQKDALDNISHKSVNVESIISLTGNLSSPKIGFDFRLPNVDQSTEEEVYALIDRSNEREMINQTVSLLLTGEFLPVSGNNDAIANAGLGNGVDFVANQVSSIITSMIKVVDVNFEYKSQTELTSDQLNIDISKEWNKFYFETTFGWGGNNNFNRQENTTLIGDMLVGYKITPYLHVIVFNRSNVNDYTKQNLPYTQGVGLKYTHSFDTWKNFFRSRNKQTDKNNSKQ